MKNFITFVRIGTDKKEFEKALTEWDEAQAKIAYVDRIEDSLERKVIVEQAAKYPQNIRQNMDLWEIKAAYAVAVMLGFRMVTGNYSVEKH